MTIKCKKCGKELWFSERAVHAKCLKCGEPTIPNLFKKKKVKIKMKYYNKIKSMICDGEHYLSMYDLVEECRRMDGYDFACLFEEMLQMKHEGIIDYDQKHESWLWLEPTEKQKEWIKDCVPINQE